MLKQRLLGIALFAAFVGCTVEGPDDDGGAGAGGEAGSAGASDTGGSGGASAGTGGGGGTAGGFGGKAGSSGLEFCGVHACCNDGLLTIRAGDRCENFSVRCDLGCRADLSSPCRDLGGKGVTRERAIEFARELCEEVSGSGGAANEGGASGNEGGVAGLAEGGVGGASPELVSCDPNQITCRVATPECEEGHVPSVDGNCYGDCVPVERCGCTGPAQCPDSDHYTCHLSAGHCGPYVR